MTTDSHRLFFAVSPDAPARAALGELLAALSRAEPGAEGLRLADAGRLHLTLQFVAHAPAAHLDALRALALEVAQREPAFELRLGGLGAFPALGRARVLWLGVEQGAAALGRLATALGAGLAALQLPVEARDCTPHLTLARTRTPSDLRGLASRVRMPAGLGFVADALELYESQLGEGPARHVRLVRAPLG